MRFINSQFILLFAIVSFSQAQNSYRGVSLGLALRNVSPYENSSSVMKARLYYSVTPTDSSDIFAQVGIDFPASLLLSAGLNISLSQYLNLQTYFGLGGIRFFTKGDDAGRTFFNTFLGIALESNVYGPIILGVAIEQRIYISYGILSSIPDLSLNTRVRL
jgi:hypothetical protein